MTLCDVRRDVCVTCAMIVRQASTVADLLMSNTKSGFLIRLTQNLRGRLQGGRGHTLQSSIALQYMLVHDVL